MTNQLELGSTERPYLDDLAELYDAFIGVMDREGSPPTVWLSSHLTGGGRALDIGCGNGRNCRLVADRYEQVVGVDVSPKVLAIAEGKDNPPNVSYDCRDVRSLSVERDGQFDAVFATNSLFSMGPVDTVLPYLRPLVAPGGKLVVVDATRPDIGPDGEDRDPTRSSLYPFQIAHTIYQMSGDVDGALAAIRYMLHPTWKAMNSKHVPLTIADFTREYDAFFPGVEITPDLVPGLTGAVWQAP